VLMKNVSSIAMFAETDLKCRRKQPARIVSAVTASHASGRGMDADANAACASTTMPAVTTTCRYTRSARVDDAGRTESLIPRLPRVRIGHRIAPQNRRVVAGRVAPQDRLPLRVVARALPRNGFPGGPAV